MGWRVWLVLAAVFAAAATPVVKGQDPKCNACLQKDGTWVCCGAGTVCLPNDGCCRTDQVCYNPNDPMVPGSNPKCCEAGFTCGFVTNAAGFLTNDCVKCPDERLCGKPGEPNSPRTICCPENTRCNSTTMMCERFCGPNKPICNGRCCNGSCTRVWNPNALRDTTVCCPPEHTCSSPYGTVCCPRNSACNTEPDVKLNKVCIPCLFGTAFCPGTKSCCPTNAPCLPGPNGWECCYPLERACGNICCKENEKCNLDTKQCEKNPVLCPKPEKPNPCWTVVETTTRLPQCCSATDTCVPTSLNKPCCPQGTPICWGSLRPWKFGLIENSMKVCCMSPQSSCLHGLDPWTDTTGVCYVKETCCPEDHVCKWQDAETGKPSGIDMCCATICVTLDNLPDIPNRICCPRSRVKSGGGCCAVHEVYIPELKACVDPKVASTGIVCPDLTISCLFKNGTRTCCPPNTDCLGGAVGCCPSKAKQACSKFPPWVPSPPACCPTKCLPLIEPPYSADGGSPFTEPDKLNATCCPNERMCLKDGGDGATTFCCGTVCVDSTLRKKTCCPRDQYDAATNKCCPKGSVAINQECCPVEDICYDEMLKKQVCCKRLGGICLRDWPLTSADKTPKCCRKAHDGDFPCWPSTGTKAAPVCCPGSSVCMGAWPPAGSAELPPTCCPKEKFCMPKPPADVNSGSCCKEGEICVGNECMKCAGQACNLKDGSVECCTADQACLSSTGCCDSGKLCLQEYSAATVARIPRYDFCCETEGSICLDMYGSFPNGGAHCCSKQQQCNVLVDGKLQLRCCKPGDECVADASAAAAGVQVCKTKVQPGCDATQTACKLANGTLSCCERGETCLDTGCCKMINNQCCPARDACPSMENFTPGVPPPTVCCSQDDLQGTCAFDPTLPAPYNASSMCCSSKLTPGNTLCFSTMPTFAAVPPVCCHSGFKCISYAPKPSCCPEKQYCESAAVPPEPAKATCCTDKQQCKNGVCQAMNH